MNHFKDLIKQYVAEAIEELLNEEAGSSIDAINQAGKASGTNINGRRIMGNKFLGRSDSPFNANQPGQSPDTAISKAEADFARSGSGMSVAHPWDENKLNKFTKGVSNQLTRAGERIQQFAATTPEQKRKSSDTLSSPMTNALKAKPVKVYPGAL